MKEVKVSLADPEGDFGGLTAEEINRVVKARAGVFRACYQHELNRSPGIGGKLVVHFVIGGAAAMRARTEGVHMPSLPSGTGATPVGGARQ